MGLRGMVEVYKFDFITFSSLAHQSENAVEIGVEVEVEFVGVGCRLHISDLPRRVFRVKWLRGRTRNSWLVSCMPDYGVTLHRTATFRAWPCFNSTNN